MIYNNNNNNIINNIQDPIGRRCNKSDTTLNSCDMASPSSRKAVPPECYSEDFHRMAAMLYTTVDRVVFIEVDDEYEHRYFSYTYHRRVAMQHMGIHSLLSIMPLQVAIHHRLVVKDIDVDKSTWPLFGTPNAIRKKRIFGQLEVLAVIARLHDQGVLAQFNVKDLKHRKKNANRINKFAFKLTRNEDNYDEHILSLNLESIRAIAALRTMWSDYNVSPEVLKKTATMGTTSVLYPEEEALFYVYDVESSDAYHDEITIACHRRH